MLDIAGGLMSERRIAMAPIIAFLTVVIAPAIADIQMSFTKWPESVTAPVGDKVTFECTVRVPGERLAWRWRPAPDAPWIEAQEHYESDGVSTRIAIQVTEKTRPGFYQCVVWYGAVVLASVPARLTIARIVPNDNNAQKRVITAPVRNTVALHCHPPVSDPPAIISWRKDDKGKLRQIDTPYGVLVLHNVTTEDTGSYSCTATNELSGQVLELPEKVHLRVQHEGHNDPRFLESEDYVGSVDQNGVLTAAVRPGEPLHLWCGIVGTPQPAVTWSRDNGPLPGRAKYDGVQLTISPLKPHDEGVYSCKAGSLRRSWRVLALQPAHWAGGARNVNGSEGSGARVSCGKPAGQPPPRVFWLMNAHPVEGDPLIITNDSELYIEHVQKRHASIVQCFACNELGCAYDAALLTVVPVQITDQDYKVAEAGRAPHAPPHPPKRHYKKNPRKHTSKPVLVPPSRPNVTRMGDDSVMVSWSNGTDGLPILFFKVQYKEATNYSNSQWNTCTQDIQPYVHTHQITGLVPDRYYKFRISAVYSNQDNKQGKSTGRFHLQRGDFRGPNKPVLLNATALSPKTILLNWTWSSSSGPQTEGFYVYYRAISSAGEYLKVSAPGAAATSLVLSHLVPDVGYEFKVQAYHTQAPSEFSAILKAKTLRAESQPAETTTEAARGAGAGSGSAAGGGTLLTAGGAAAAALLCLLAVALLLCRRAKRPHRDKEKVSVPEGGGANGYNPAKVPITITANPMHAEGGENGVEMSYMHNNNTGNDDNTLPHSRKNGPTNRQYV